MTDLSKPPSTSMAAMVQRSIAKRAAGGAVARPQPAPPKIPKALLLDVSGSMNGASGDPRISRIEALRRLVLDLELTPEQPVYAFSDDCGRIEGEIPAPGGSTYMSRAFARLKADGHRAVVLITDGEPSDKEEALREAVGLFIEILYVGPTQKRTSPFLAKIAKAGKGSAQQRALGTNAKELTATVKGLLA